jgi:hypothetical protein
MKRIVVVIVFLLLSGTVAVAQKKKASKLPKEEMSKMTPDQRFVHESGRKSKKDGRTSSKKKAKIQKKQVRKAEHMRAPSQKKRRVKN